MRARWQAVHDHLARTLDRHSTREAFGSMRHRRKALAQVPDPIALLDWLHHANVGPDRKNAVLLALVLEVQSDGPDGQIAVTLLHFALWPGLDAVYRRLQIHYRDDPDLLVSELSGHFFEQVTRLDPDRVIRIAATILMNIERDVKRALIVQASEQKHQADHCDVVAPDKCRCGSALALSDGTDPEHRPAIIVDRLRAVIGQDADLIVDVVIRGLSLKEAGARHGLSYDAARKRHARALRRLRQTFGDFF